MASPSRDFSPIAVADNFHFSHYYWRSWDLTNNHDENPEDNASDSEDILKPKPITQDDIKLRFYTSVLDTDTVLHFGKWDGIAMEQPDAYGKASEAMTDFMFALAMDLQPHRRNALDFAYIDLGSGTGASAIRIIDQNASVARATCLNLCHEQNIAAHKLAEEKKLLDRMEIVEGTFEDAPFQNETFDLVFSQDAFIHAVSKKQTYSEAYRLAKPGGAFVFCDLMAGDKPDLTNKEQQIFAKSNVLNDWLTPEENVLVCQRSGWKEVHHIDLTADMRISFQLMLKKVNFVLEHGHPGSNMNRVLLMNYSKKIKERIKQIDRGVFKWCVIHARKPIALKLLCQPPVPFVNTSNLILQGTDEEPSVVVVDILKKMPHDKVQALPKSVKMLITLSAGLDHIDLKACSERGIAVKQSGRDAITSHVVQYGLAFIILALRDALNQMTVPFPSNGWNLNWNCEGVSLTDAKIAIIGMGVIGKELVAQIRAIAPDTHILYYVPEMFRDNDAENKYKLEYYSSIESMAAECDVLVPMCPLNQHTEGIVSRKVISKLKPSAGLVNIARGKIVDTDALVESLENKAIKYAILDTTFPEPLPEDHKLWKLDNCFIFPHYATNTMTVRKALVDEIQPLIEEHYGLGNSDQKLRQLEKELRYNLAVAHRLTAKMGWDMLVWNHISARFKSGCLITPGRMLWNQVTPEDLVYSSSNVTADIIHDAIYAADPEIKAVMHLHTPAAVAVSCLECGFIPLTQDSAYFYNKVINYKWDGVSDDVSEGPLISAAVRAAPPGSNTLLLENHGFVCFGRSVKEVWVLCYYFERACETQLRCMQTGAKIRIPSEKVMVQAAKTSYLPDFAPGACEWEALCKEVSFE